MKEKRIKPLKKIADAGGSTLGCLLMIALFIGVMFAISFLMKWIFSLSFIRGAGYHAEKLTARYGYILGYIVLVYLAFCIAKGVMIFYHDKKKSADEVVKITWELFLKGIGILTIFSLYFILILYTILHFL